MESFQEAARNWPRTRALICDIDETICTEFDRPIAVAVAVLRQLDRAIEVHYVTARPEASRLHTLTFFGDHGLPGHRNVRFCPTSRSTRQHKIEEMTKIARQCTVIASIGDADEDEHASRSAGVVFVRVLPGEEESAWAEIARLVGVTMGSGMIPGETGAE
jgi:phosphoglycolate phosphatase-like HAD superfamily hydrolase